MMDVAMAVGGRADAGKRARLHLEELGSAVVTDVMHRGLYRMTVAQKLPFLRLHSGVRDEEGRPARIESVSVDLLDGTPSIVLELVYEDEEPVRVRMPRAELSPPKRKRRDDTVPYETAVRDAEIEIPIGDGDAALATQERPRRLAGLVAMLGRVFAVVAAWVA